MNFVKLDNPHVISKRKTGRKNKQINYSKSIHKDRDKESVKTIEESSCSNDPSIINNGNFFES